MDADLYPRPMRNVRRDGSRTRSARTVAALLVAAGLVALAGCGDDAADQEFVGYRSDPSQQVGELSLPDVSAGGVPFTFDPAPGRFQIVYFGYTSCPDVCPTTLAAVRNALRDLGEDADRIDLAMATVDPDRDTDEVLTGYVQSFFDGAHALRTTEDDALAEVADTFGATYSVNVNDEGIVEVAHSGATYVVAPGGSVTLTWPFGVTADDIEGDLELLMKEFPA
jgi:protein SCO1